MNHFGNNIFTPRWITDKRLPITKLFALSEKFLRFIVRHLLYLKGEILNHTNLYFIHISFLSVYIFECVFLFIIDFFRICILICTYFYYILLQFKHITLTRIVLSFGECSEWEILRNLARHAL